MAKHVGLGLFVGAKAAGTSSCRLMDPRFWSLTLSSLLLRTLPWSSNWWARIVPLLPVSPESKHCTNASGLHGLITAGSTSAKQMAASGRARLFVL